MGIPKKVLFSSWTAVLLISTAYAALELTVRYMDLPDPEMIRDMRSEMKTRDSPDTYPASDSTPPVYGWDQPPIIIPRNTESVMIDSTYSILFVGDSLTRGFGLSNFEEEAYPSLLFQTLGQISPIQLVNVSVQGFGVDQMILKLEEALPLYKPDLVVFAYIPHDLWRAGRNINYGWTKPVLIDFQSDTWTIIPAPKRWQYYQDFNDSERGYYRGIWYLRHLFNNARYYFTDFHMDYYRNLFDAIRRRLMVLGEKHHVQILVVRLASTWPGDAVSALDREAHVVFEEATKDSDYGFVDLENCVRTKLSTAGIDYVEAYKWHPDKLGHTMYAACLENPLRKFIGMEKHKK